MPIPLTSIKVRFVGEDWTWVTFHKAADGSITTSDDRLTAKWKDGKVTFHVHAALEAPDQGVMIHP
jgi:hypothetical protein